VERGEAERGDGEARREADEWVRRWTRGMALSGGAPAAEAGPETRRGRRRRARARGGWVGARVDCFSSPMVPQTHLPAAVACLDCASVVGAYSSAQWTPELSGVAQPPGMRLGVPDFVMWPDDVACALPTYTATPFITIASVLAFSIACSLANQCPARLLRAAI